MTVVGYTFNERFATKILNGSKQQTVRSGFVGKAHVQPGQLMQFWTGMRLRARSLLGTATCASICRIEIDTWIPVVTYLGTILSTADELDEFAIADGFASWAAMRDYWLGMHGTSAWAGVLIKWTDFVPAQPLMIGTLTDVN